VDYFHVVFTLPENVADLAHANPAVIYDLLMTSAATLRDVAGRRLPVHRPSGAAGGPEVAWMFSAENAGTFNARVPRPIKQSKSIAMIRPLFRSSCLLLVALLIATGCKRGGPGTDPGAVGNAQGGTEPAKSNLPYEPLPTHPLVELSAPKIDSRPTGIADYKVSWRMTRQSSERASSVYLVIKSGERSVASRVELGRGRQGETGTISGSIMGTPSEGGPLARGCEMYVVDKERLPHHKLSNSVTVGDVSVTPTQPAPPPSSNTPPPSKEPPPIFLRSPSASFKVDVDTVTGFSLSPDGSTAGIAGKGKLKVGAPVDHITPFYDLNKLAKVGVPIKSNGPGTISNGGNTAVYRDIDYKVIAYDIKTGKETVAAELTRGSHYALSPDGKLLVTADKMKLVFRSWRAGGKPLEVDTKTPVLALSRVFQQGTRVAALHGDRTGAVVRVWDVKTGQAVDEMPLNRPPLTRGIVAESLLVAEDGKATIVSKEADGGSEIWDLSTKKKSSWPVPFAKTVYPVAGGRVSYLNTELKIEGTSSQSFEMIAVVDAQTGAMVHKLQLPQEVKRTLNFYYAPSADGNRFAAVCGDTHRIYVWDVSK
jgi:WD40 repeat protein